MKKGVHYEAAFESYLREQGWPYVAVNERRRAIDGVDKLKSFDFVVYSDGPAAWLVDVKGRKFPYVCDSGVHYWENWVTADDLVDLLRWEDVFGPGYTACFIFAYWLTIPLETEIPFLFTFKERDYFFACISAQQYRRHARQRSDRWETLSLRRKDFKRLAYPLQQRNQAKR